MLTKGALELVEATDEVIAFVRKLEGRAPIFCAFNLGTGTRQITLPEAAWAEIEGLGFQADIQDGVLTLPPEQAFIAEG